MNIDDKPEASLGNTFVFVFLQPSTDGAVASEPNAGQRLVIWGTDVNVGTCKEKFQVRNITLHLF